VLQVVGFGVGVVDAQVGVGVGFGVGGEFAVGVGESEVDDLDVLLAVEQHVFGLEVAVDDAEAVQVVDAVDDLVEEAAGLAFGQPRWAGEYFFCSAM
jgi:hypothetical protein